MKKIAAISSIVIFIFLFAYAFMTELKNLYVPLYITLVLLIIVSWFIFKEEITRIRQLTPFTLLGYHKTILKCPKCGYKLRQHVMFSQLFACPNCGYTGPLGLKEKKQ